MVLIIIPFSLYYYADCLQCPPFLLFQGTTLMLLKKAYYNRKPVERPRAKKNAEENLEDASTEEGHDKQLISEMQKAKPDLRKIYSLLRVSFNHRRKWIEKLKGKGTTRQILEKYPGFKHHQQVTIAITFQYFKAWSNSGNV